MMENAFTVGLITLIVVFITYLIYKRYLTPGETLPGPKAWPFFGNLIMVSRAKNFYQLTKDLQKEYGNVFRLKLGQITIVFISGHTNISKVMVDDGENSSHRPTWMFCPKHIFKGKGNMTITLLKPCMSFICKEEKIVGTHSYVSLCMNCNLVRCNLILILRLHLCLKKGDKISKFKFKCIFFSICIRRSRD